MTWVLIDDHANEHPKLLQVGSEAAWLWICGMMYCRRNRTSGGRLPSQVLRMLYPFTTCPDTLAQRLVDAGLWHVIDGGYEVHDYDEWMAKGRRSVTSESRGERRERTAKPGQNTGKPTPKHVRRLSGQHACNTTGQSPDLPDPIRSDPIRSDPNYKPDDVDPSLTGHSPQPAYPDAAQTSEEPGHGTGLPLDFADRFPSPALADMAKAHGVHLRTIEHTLREFVAYWTVGGGAGQTRERWPALYRRRVHEQAKAGDLARLDAKLAAEASRAVYTDEMGAQAAAAQRAARAQRQAEREAKARAKEAAQ